MYRVIETFRDLQDGHLYQPGEPFPHDGRGIPAQRLDALKSGRNAANKRLIVEDKEAPVEAPKRAERAGKTRKIKG